MLKHYFSLLYKYFKNGKEICEKKKYLKKNLVEEHCSNPIEQLSCK